MKSSSQLIIQKCDSIGHWHDYEGNYRLPEDRYCLIKRDIKVNEDVLEYFTRDRRNLLFKSK